MNYSILNEIKKIRGQDRLDIRADNSNEYRVLVREDGGISAYYFSSPIYNQINKRLLDFNIEKDERGFFSNGINAQIFYFNDKIVIQNEKGTVNFKFKPQNFLIKSISEFCNTEREYLVSENYNIFPTLNGAMLEIKGNDSDYIFTIEFSRSFVATLENDNFLFFMLGEHLPYCGINALFAKSSEREYFPLKLSNKKHNDNIYTVSFEIPKRAKNEKQLSYFFEINAYAPKLIFDTTVESANPDKNNAYGSAAFLGHSAEYGEQWLYSRINPSKLWDLNGYSVEKATFFAPKFSSVRETDAFEIRKLTAPWCSFETTWNAKKSPEIVLGRLTANNGYVSGDVTEILRDILRIRDAANPGIVIKPINAAENQYTVIATADSYCMPQILEIKLASN